MMCLLMKVLQVLKNVAILGFNIIGNIICILPLQLNNLMQLLFIHAHT